MKRIREALRYHEQHNMSLRRIARALSVSRPVISEYLDKCRESGITYEISQALSDDELTLILSEKKPEEPRLTQLKELFPKYAKELTRKGVTRQLLWEEYLEHYPEGYGYSQFCHHFTRYNKGMELYMRMEHKAGDKLFVDFTGEKMKIVDHTTGEIRPVEVFVAALGASKLIYAEAVPSQKKHDFIAAQVHALRYIGGVPAAIVPDCLKSAITKGHRYEPDINPEYHDFARHYGATILSARPYKPKDKAIVEGSVRIVYQRIFAPLRDHVFHSIDELNRAIREKLEVLNHRTMQEYRVSRWELFTVIEKHALMELPAEDYVIRHHKRLKVQYNYHIYLSEDRNYYSVPYRFRGKHVDLLYTDSSVEIYHNNDRIACHKRSRRAFSYTTEKEHMPENHKYQDNWDPDKLMSWAASIGPGAKEAVETVLCRKEHPEQGYKTCLGILNLGKEYGRERLNRACRRALEHDSVSYKFIHNNLKNGLEDEPSEEPAQMGLFSHENIRGPQYYIEEEL